MIVIQDGTAVETATFRSEESYGDGRHPDWVVLSSSLSEDAKRRDFTVNALYLDITGQRLLDPTGGKADCEHRLLRTVGDPGDRFQEDALRLLRAPRLAAQCNLSIHPDTHRALALYAEGIRRVSAERIGKEVSLLLTGADPARALTTLSEVGLLDIILPEVAALQGVPQPPEYHPEGDVWTHTLLMLQLSKQRTLALGLGILLHDIGKPVTITHADRIRFNGHTTRGEEMTRQIGRRLRLSNRIINRAAALVRDHMRFLDVQQMRPATLKRFLRQPGIEELLELHRLDCLASHAKLDNYEFSRRMLAELKQEDLRPPPLLRGRDLLALGYQQGPQLGRMLKELETAQLDGRVTTRAEAESWLQQHFPLPPPPSDQ
jgi:poly(A) polymerase